MEAHEGFAPRLAARGGAAEIMWPAGRRQKNDRHDAGLILGHLIARRERQQLC
jgi:hypothetical protein